MILEIQFIPSDITGFAFTYAFGIITCLVISYILSEKDNSKYIIYKQADEILKLKQTINHLISNNHGFYKKKNSK